MTIKIRYIGASWIRIRFRYRSLEEHPIPVGWGRWSRQICGDNYNYKRLCASSMTNCSSIFLTLSKFDGVWRTVIHDAHLLQLENYLRKYPNHEYFLICYLLTTLMYRARHVCLYAFPYPNLGVILARPGTGDSATLSLVDDNLVYPSVNTIAKWFDYYNFGNSCYDEHTSLWIIHISRHYRK